MNIIGKAIRNLTRFYTSRPCEVPGTSLITRQYHNHIINGGNIFQITKNYLTNSIFGSQQIRNGASLLQMHRRGPHIKKRKSKNPFNGAPLAKGVVLKVLIKHPKKPNSANRKCVLVRLSNGKEMLAHIPGEGHSLQEHNIVLCRVGRCKDVPHVKIKCVRGAYDLPHVIKRRQ